MAPSFLPIVPDSSSHTTPSYVWISPRAPLGGSTTHSVLIFLAIGAGSFILLLSLYLMVLSKWMSKPAPPKDSHPRLSHSYIKHQPSVQEIPKLFPATRPRSLQSQVASLPPVRVRTTSSTRSNARASDLSLSRNTLQQPSSSFTSISLMETDSINHQTLSPRKVRSKDSLHILRMPLPRTDESEDEQEAQEGDKRAIPNPQLLKKRSTGSIQVLGDFATSETGSQEIAYPRQACLVPF